MNITRHNLSVIQGYRKKTYWRCYFWLLLHFFKVIDKQLKQTRSWPKGFFNYPAAFFATLSLTSQSRRVFNSHPSPDIAFRETFQQSFLLCSRLRNSLLNKFFLVRPKSPNCLLEEAQPTFIGNMELVRKQRSFWREDNQEKDDSIRKQMGINLKTFCFFNTKY